MALQKSQLPWATRQQRSSTTASTRTRGSLQATFAEDRSEKAALLQTQARAQMSLSCVAWIPTEPLPNDRERRVAWSLAELPPLLFTMGISRDAAAPNSRTSWR